MSTLHGEIDININSYLQLVKSDTSRRSANKGTLFYLNMTKTVQAHMNFNRLARLWNKLPQHIRMSDSLSSFKRQLGVLYKSHLKVWSTVKIRGTRVSQKPIVPWVRQGPIP